MREFLRLPSGRELVAPERKKCHAYGDLYLAAEYCGFENPPTLSVPFEWQHGWAPSFLNYAQ